MDVDMCILDTAIHLSTESQMIQTVISQQCPDSFYFLLSHLFLFSCNVELIRIFKQHSLQIAVLRQCA